MYNFDQIIDRKHTNCVKWDECPNEDVLPLWVADMDFPTAPCVQEAIVRRAAHGCYGYTLVPDAYYQAIQDWFATRHQWNIERDHILYTIGVVPAIAAILKAHCQTGDNVVLLTPVYNCFFNLIRNAGCQAIEVALATVPRSSVSRLTYDIDWEALEQALALEKTTTLLFCNPHNPAGRIWSEEEILRVATLCQQHNVLLISDEIHNELTSPDRMYVPVGRAIENSKLKIVNDKLNEANGKWEIVNDKLMEQVAPSSSADSNNSPFNIYHLPFKYVVTTSPSKSFNIAGLQNAFIVCPDADLRRRIDRAINLNETCDVNPFGVEALIAAYTEGGEWLDELRQYIHSNYQYACSQLQAFPEIGIADMQGSYLMWVDCRTICQRLGIDSAELSRRLIIDHHIWFAAGSIYGHAGEGFLRINLACPRTTLAEAFKRFTHFLDETLHHG